MCAPVVPATVASGHFEIVTKDAQVVDPDGKPIPRLYNAGEFGSIYGFLYQDGGNLAECIAFGRIAGKNGAAEKP